MKPNFKGGLKIKDYLKQVMKPNFKGGLGIKDYLKQVMKPNFKGGVLMGADLMSCEMGKVKVKMNKPVYLVKLYWI